MLTLYGEIKQLEKSISNIENSIVTKLKLCELFNDIDLLNFEETELESLYTSLKLQIKELQKLRKGLK